MEMNDGGSSGAGSRSQGGKNSKIGSQALRSINRRSVLSAIGSSSVGAAMMSSIVSANPGQRQLTGITYDTLTHEFQRPAFADVTFDDDGGVSGTLELAGYSMEVGGSNPVTPDRTHPEPEYTVKKRANTFTREGLPLKIRFVAPNGEMSGTMTRPSGDYGRLGFTFTDPTKLDMSPQETRDAAKRLLMGDGDGIVPSGMNYKPQIPNTGIPAATGFRNVAGGEQK